MHSTYDNPPFILNDLDVCFPFDGYVIYFLHNLTRRPLSIESVFYFVLELGVGKNITFDDFPVHVLSN